MNPSADVVVVGSGASGVHVALPLVERGLRVTMLDVGYEDLTYERLIPGDPFVDIRKSDRNQSRYFLGDHFEGVSSNASQSGPQITPPRAYVLKNSQQLAPKRGKNFDALESFALGGLARAWGAVAFPFNDFELSQCGLPAPELREHYEAVAARIGVSGRSNDDLRALRGPLGSLQAPLRLDHNAEAIFERYARSREDWMRRGIYLGQSFLAVLSEKLGNRRPNSYTDMDFWSNEGQSVYRPNVTLSELQRHPNFSYRSGFLVSKFEEAADGSVILSGKRLGDAAEEQVGARCLVLAAGSLGTTRIVLRSLGLYDHAVPLVCNAHTYMPCLNLRDLGKPHAEQCHSLAQLTLVYDPTNDGKRLVQAQMYSYRSLFLFRLLRGMPLPHREGLRVFRSLAPQLVIWVIQHEDLPSGRKHCVLRRGRVAEEDCLEIEFDLSEDDKARQRRAERSISRFLRNVGCWPTSRVRPAHGASVHYAGQFPMTSEQRPMTTELSGRLRGTRAVYLADGSILAYLPAKGPTLTLMANAYRIGAGIASKLAT
jgi:choline dehydrogenase-like flavoprotein